MNAGQDIRSDDYGVDTGPESALPPVDVSELNDEQFRAYEIITQHLGDYLQGKAPKPLRMIVYGEGGTGKSQVIQTVTETF
jgi:Cdc6-like AAA superfamily ATPase